MNIFYWRQICLEVGVIKHSLAMTSLIKDDDSSTIVINLCIILLPCDWDATF